MSFVLDCSMTMAWVFSDESTKATEGVRELLLDTDALVPALWPMEVANVLLVATRRGRLSMTEWPEVCDSLLALPIHVDAESSERVLREVLPLADTHSLSVYDAIYLELAVRMQLPLATLDRQLSAASATCGVTVIGSP